MRDAYSNGLTADELIDAIRGPNQRQRKERGPKVTSPFPTRLPDTELAVSTQGLTKRYGKRKHCET